MLKGEPALVDSTSPRSGEKASYYTAVCAETGGPWAGRPALVGLAPAAAAERRGPRPTGRTDLAALVPGMDLNLIFP